MLLTNIQQQGFEMLHKSPPLLNQSTLDEENQDRLSLSNENKVRKSRKEFFNQRAKHIFKKTNGENEYNSPLKRTSNFINSGEINKDLFGSKNSKNTISEFTNDDIKPESYDKEYKEEDKGEFEKEVDKNNRNITNQVHESK